MRALPAFDLGLTAYSPNPLVGARGRIAGLGVDVFSEEPLPLNHPFRYLPHVVSTPHIGYVVEESYRVYLGDCVANAMAFINGTPARVIN